MRPTVEQVTECVLAMAEVIPFFPQTQLGQSIIAEHLRMMIDEKDKLDWFVGAACRHLTKYEGVGMLRAIYALKYAPADGHPIVCEVPGLGEAELEADFKRREMIENEIRFEEYKRQALLAPPEDQAPFVLPVLKSLPEPTAEDKAAAAEFVKNLPAPKDAESSGAAVEPGGGADGPVA
jgi:hypothetical protein